MSFKLQSNIPGFRKDIDGLRALAVLAVVGFHAFPAKIPGGFVGVDIFFIISGYLISLGLFKNIESNNYSISDFYVRRIRRIFPALIFVLLSVATLGWLLLLPDEFMQLGKHLFGGVTFVSNFILWRESGYFDTIADTKPLLHLWSLSIEEQFYIIWPLLMMFCHRVKINKLWATLLFIFLSFSFNICVVYSDSAQAFYSPLSRFWEILLGGVLAYVVTYKNKDLSLITKNTLSFTGGILIIIGFTLSNKDSLFPGWVALLPTIGTVLIIGSGPLCVLNRLFSLGPIVWLGGISYPLYLWHWPLLSFIKILQPTGSNRELRITAVIVSVLLAWLTQQLVEKPFRFKISRSKSILVLSTSLLLVGLFGSTIFYFDGLPSRRSLNHLSVTNHEDYKWDKELLGDPKCKEIKEFELFEHCLIDSYDKAVDSILIGDSHSNHFYTGLAAIFRKEGKNLQNLGSGGCVPFWNVNIINNKNQESCNKLMNMALDHALYNPNIDTILLAVRGAWNVSKSGFVLEGHTTDDNFGDREIRYALNPQLTDQAEIFEKAMDATFKKLNSSDKRVFFILNSPEMGFDPRICSKLNRLNIAQEKVFEPCGIPLSKVNERNFKYNSIVKKISFKYPNIKFLDPKMAICNQDFCWAKRERYLIYRDDDHLSIHGSHLVAKNFKNFIFR